MTTIEELVVRAKPEGIEETSEGFDQMQEDLDEVEEGMDETAGSMEDASNKWRGAMGSIVTGLAVGTAGILSQVPVLGEALGGLLSIVDGLAYQMDQVLRPVLQPVTSAFYDFSGAIFELDGIAGDIVGVLTTIGAVIGTVAGVAKLLGTSLTALIGWFASLGPAIAGITAGAAALAAGVGVIIGLLGVLILEMTGVLDWFHQLGQDTRPVLDDIIDGVGDIIDKLGEIADWAVEKVEGAFDWITDALSDPAGTVSDILSDLETIADDTWDTIVEIVMQLTDPVTGAPGGLESDVQSGLANLDPRNWNQNGSGGTASGLLQNQTRRNTNVFGQAGASIFLDGQDLSESTGRYRAGDLLIRRNP